MGQFAGADMSELFEDLPPSPSPKLAWLKKNRLSTGKTVNGWRCYNAGYTWIGVGQTEDEAILDYCHRHNLQHWTVENLHTNPGP